MIYTAYRDHDPIYIPTSLVVFISAFMTVGLDLPTDGTCE